MTKNWDRLNLSFASFGVICTIDLLVDRYSIT